VVYGTSPYDRGDVTAMRDAFAAYRGRLDLIELTDMRLDELLNAVGSLPEHTAILFYTLLRDSAGGNHVPTHVLERIARRTRLPVYGVSDRYIDHGIVGGRVISFRRHAREAVALAAAVLRKESSNAPASVDDDLNVTMFDAQALKRVGLGGARLPPDSIIVNREPSFWSLYRPYVVPALAVVLAQAAVIALLLGQRHRRALAQHALALNLRFEKLVADTSTMLATTPVENIETAIQRGVTRAHTEIGGDRGALFEFTEDQRVVRIGLSGDDVAPTPMPTPMPTTLERERYPWTLDMLRRGTIVQFRSPDELPAEAAADRATFEQLGTRSLLCVPAQVGPDIVGALWVESLHNEHACPPAVISRLRLLADIFANALLRRRARLAISESEDRFRIAADSAPMMMWMSGVDGGCIYFNRAWLSFTGRTLDDELGTGWAERVHPDDRAACLQQYETAFTSREPFTLEYRLRRHDDEYRWLVNRGVPRFTGTAKFSGYIGAATDVTDVKAAQASLLESVALRGAIFGSLYGHVAALDKDGVIVAVNAAWTEFGAAGWDMPRPSVGANYVAACDHASNAAGGGLATAVHAVLNGERPRATLEYSTRAGSEERWFEMAVEPFQRPEGGVIVSHVDITRRRRAETDAQRQREELAHALRAAALGALAGSLAHEINQPLAAIAANARAARLLLDAGSGERGELGEVLTDIADDVKRAGDVIRRLRGLVRKDQSEYRLADINALILDVMMLLRGDLEWKGIAVELLLAKDLPPLWGDAIQLQQVILNLAMNAAEAMAHASVARPLIAIETRLRAPHTVDITVRDNGPGVNDVTLERIFEPFVTTKSGGLGMGLSISRSIIQAHGGRMWATPSAPHGLTVHVELPLHRADLQRQ
jgi:two-component system sensor kinase FixL